MAFLTVFTPTYNRANLLPRAYEALRQQSNKDFIWLIIDDGSTDGTQQLVQQWCDQEKMFRICYVYKENGGLHTGYNAAIERLDTELAVCVDSDDYLAADAVDRIHDFWIRYGSMDVAGIVALDGDNMGNVIGDPLPDQERINLLDLLIGKYPIRNGDRKLVLRSELYKRVAPQRVFPGEKNFNPHYMHLQISKEYDFLVMNEILCVVEYQPEGMSNQMYRQYFNSPRSFAEIRRLYLSFENAGIRFRFKQCIHYVASSFLSKDRHFVETSPAKLMTILAIPFGAVLFALIKIKARD